MNEYIIVFHDKSTKWITEEQALGLSKAMDNPATFSKWQNIGDNKIALSSVAKILSKNEYKEQYPNKETGRVFQNQFKALPELIDYKYESIQKKASRHKGQIGQMIEGITRYINENPDRCENAKEKREEMELAMARL